MLDIPLILFAKAPEVGKVKTRLTPKLSLTESAEVAKVLLEETLTLTTQSWPGKVILAVWPDLENDFIQTMLSKYEVSSITQVEGDLGQKMFAAMEDCDYPCAVMGCDVPHCSTEILLDAYQRLSTGQNIIGPTLDGGYYLLGLQQSNMAIFDNSEWGGEDVFNASMSNAKADNIFFTQLKKLSDIDTYSDLVNASQSLTVLKKFLKN